MHSALSSARLTRITLEPAVVLAGGRFACKAAMQLSLLLGFLEFFLSLVFSFRYAQLVIYNPSFPVHFFLKPRSTSARAQPALPDPLSAPCPCYDAGSTAAVA